MFCLPIDSAVAERLTSLRSDTDSTQVPAPAHCELQMFTRTQDALESYKSDIPEVQLIDHFNQVKNQYNGPQRLCFRIRNSRAFDGRSSRFLGHGPPSVDRGTVVVARNICSLKVVHFKPDSSFIHTAGITPNGRLKEFHL